MFVSSWAKIVTGGEATLISGNSFELQEREAHKIPAREPRSSSWISGCRMMIKGLDVGTIRAQAEKLEAFPRSVTVNLRARRSGQKS